MTQHFNIEPTDTYKISGVDLVTLWQIKEDLPGRFAIPIHNIIVNIVKSGPIKKEEANANAN